MYAFLTRNFRWIAGGFLLTFFSSFGQTFFVSASVAQWQATFDLSHGEFGRLYMLATLASALCLPMVGRMVDVMPEHRTILIVVPILATATLLAAYATSIWMLAIAIVLLRLFGQGMMTHIALTATGRWFALERGRAVSLVVLGHQGGEATLPLLFASIAAGYGYQAGWIAGAVALLLICLPLACWAYHKPRTPEHHGAAEKANRPAVRSWTRSEMLSDPIFWVLLIGVLAPPFIGTTIFYHQDYLTELNAWPPRLYAMSLTVMAVTTVVFALLCGALIDRFSAVNVLPFFLLPLSATCFMLSSGGPDEMLFVVMVLLGISYGISSTLLGAIWPEVYGIANLGAIRSVIISVMVFATAAGPGLTGTLIDRGMPLPTQMQWAGLYCLVAAGVVAAASLQLRKRRRAAAAQVDASC
jgi:MFS family permease